MIIKIVCRKFRDPFFDEFNEYVKMFEARLYRNACDC